MVDAHALGACGLGRAGSHPASPTRGTDHLTGVARDDIRNFGLGETTRSDSLMGRRYGHGIEVEPRHLSATHSPISNAVSILLRITAVDISQIKTRTLHAISPLKSSSSPCFFGTRTNAGRELPDYYLVYFMLVDLLGFRHLGRGEKVAWSLPVDFEGRTYIIEHRKMGLGVFSSGGSECEEDAKKIVRLVKQGVSAARPYFDWRADESLKGSKVNVYNDSVGLFDRFEFFLGLFESKRTEGDGEQFNSGSYQLYRETEWLAIATIESFFSWTEHVFIHLAILQGNCTTGVEVDELAAKNWQDKFKAALDLQNPETKRHYDDLLAIRNQVRNFVAHGSFGKNGKAFKFHSAAGAVPVMLPHRRLSGSNRFPDADSIKSINEFIAHLRAGPLAPAWIFLDNRLSTILTEAKSGVYDSAMASESDMQSFVDYRDYIEDMSANMDF